MYEIKRLLLKSMKHVYCRYARDQVKSLTMSDEHGEQGVMKWSASGYLKKAGVLANTLIIACSYCGP